MTFTLDLAPACTLFTYMGNGQAALQTVLDRSPASIRSLAHAAGVSEGLLRAIRDGRRRLTPEVREALVAALRERAMTYGDLADQLEAVDLETGGEDG